MQVLPQNIPYVPYAPLTNGVFLQQNQFLPKICGSPQICACDHYHLFVLFVYLPCICIYMEKINIYPWFLRIWTLISGSSLPNVFFESMNPDLQNVQKKRVSRHFLAQVYFKLLRLWWQLGLTTKRMNSPNI